MKEVLQSYLKRLTDLSASNRSLVLLRLLKDQYLDLHRLDFATNQPSFHIVSSLLEGSNGVNICDRQDSRDATINELNLRLRRINRVDQYIFEERGSRDLYVGWPFVCGKFADGTMVRCPLLFIPVTLQQDDNEWKLIRRAGVSITFNKTFLLAYAYFNGISVPDELIEHTFDGRITDSTVFRTELYTLLKESPVELNFNQENFMDVLQTFREYTRPQFAEVHEDGLLKLFPEAVLGIFPQAGSYLVPDYLHLIESEPIDDIESFFADRTRKEDLEGHNHSPDFFYFLNKVKEDETFIPFKVDAFQENAIKAVKRGNSMVVIGPPGTGKSQLISNLISDFMARGKNVLLVCQKRAALDVVYERLGEAGLADFAALVHDFRNDRKSIYSKIADQIDKLYEYKIKNNSLDAIQLERTFLQASHRIDSITEQFEEFKHALFDESEAGLSVKELYLTSDRLERSVNLKQEYRHFRLDVLHEFIDRLRVYHAYHRRYAQDDYLWRLRKDFGSYGISDLKNMRRLLDEIPAYGSKFAGKTGQLLGSELGVMDAEKIHAGKDRIHDMLALLNDETTYGYFRHMIRTREITSDSFPDTLWLNTARSKLMGCFEKPGPEISLNPDELGSFQKVLKRRSDARSNLLKMFKWLFARREKEWIRKVIARNKLSRASRKFRLLEQKVDLRLNYEHNMTLMKGTKWLIGMPEVFSKKKIEEWFEQQNRAISAFLIFDSFRNFREYFSDQQLDLDDFAEKMRELIGYVDEIPDVLYKWRAYFLDLRIEMLLSRPELAPEMRKTLDDDFDGLCDFDNMRSEMPEHELRVIDKMLEEPDIEDEDAVEALFQNSLRLAWIDHIETKYPILRSVNSLKFERMQKDLQEAAKEKLRTSREIALLRSRERTYQNVEFNRLNNMITYRDLTHQVTKKRRIWPIRKLLHNFSDEVFNLLPCWMASPESVSAIFPMEQMFDLVVFDEASQCFAERGIPAMYRGRQVVVAGDPMQLSPFDLYSTRWEEDEEQEELALEVDSLLDLASSYIMKTHLGGHYRSKSLQLIDFSNHFFYKGKLQLLPDRHWINRDEPSIEYIKVDGVWERNTNTAEAQATVDLVMRLMLEKPDHSIGIVTFNARQQDCIMELLETALEEQRLSMPGSMIIKNIENVQGDEKDIIIFSVGYAPDKKGRMRHHFGSLNARKGENRLNVAVTRAREKIYVVSSIMPEQLRVEDTKNEGPKMLKKYLQYALDVSEGRYRPEPGTGKQHNRDWYLKYKIQGMHLSPDEAYRIEPELPFADLTIAKNEQYLGLVLTDDDLYHDSVSVKAPHIYKPFTLSAKNWRFRGVYSREYWHDRDAVKERISRFIGLLD